MADVVLIMGGTGFAGSHLAEYLLAKPNPPELHLTHVTPVSPELKTLLTSACFHQCDLSNSRQVKELLARVRPNQLYQLASLPIVGNSFEQPTNIIRDNVQIVDTVLTAVRETVPHARILMITSAEVYGSGAKPGELINEQALFAPLNPYGVSKVAQDLLADCMAKAYGLQVIRVRPFNHIGERQGRGFVVADFAAQIVAIERGAQSEIIVGNLASERDFTDVKDIVAGYALLMAKGDAGAVYNLGTGRAVTIQSILDSLLAEAQVECPVRVDSKLLRPNDIQSRIADAGRARALGWQPVISLDQTISRILTYWRTQ